MKTLLVIVCLAALLLAGAVYYATHRVPFDRRSWVQAGYMDSNGKFVKTDEFQEAKPEKFYVNGLSHVDAFAKRLVEPKLIDASLIISSINGNKSCLLMRLGGPTVIVMENITLAPPSEANPKRGKAARKFFKELGIRETHDDIHEYNGTPDAMEDLEYPIGDDPAYVAKVTRSLLKEVDGVTDHEGLSFRFEADKPNVAPNTNVFIGNGE